MPTEEPLLALCMFCGEVAFFVLLKVLRVVFIRAVIQSHTTCLLAGIFISGGGVCIVIELGRGLHDRYYKV